ncbi:hypothetical protein AN219_37915 [Streptomyces nanshensis]|nr:hypothetical protein AN219_37915 [Streptomyces nanshensis]
MQAFLDLLLPCPAYILDAHWNVVARNSPEEEWFDWVPYEPNTLRWIFLYPEARQRLVNWRDEWAKPALAQLRMSIATHPDDPELRSLQREVLSGSEEAQEIWQEKHSQIHPDGEIRQYRLQGAEVPLMVIALAPLRNQDLRVMVLLRDWDDHPNDGATGAP